MAIIKKKPLKKTLSRENSQEKFWDEVEQKARYLIADLLNKSLPLPNLRDKKNFNLDRDADYNGLLFEYENNYSDFNQTEDLAQDLAEEIAYEYLFLVIRSLSRELSQFNCYQPDHFENLTE